MLLHLGRPCDGVVDAHAHARAVEEHPLPHPAPHGLATGELPDGVGPLVREQFLLHHEAEPHRLGRRAEGELERVPLGVDLVASCLLKGVPHDLVVRELGHLVGKRVHQRHPRA